MHADFTAAVRAMTRSARTFEPIAANAALYEELYQQVYRRMYKGLAPLYARIRRITGYPPAD
jgi:sugar (pentulose or hexulose) kinase